MLYTYVIFALPALFSFTKVCFYTLPLRIHFGWFGGKHPIHPSVPLQVDSWGCKLRLIFLHSALILASNHLLLDKHCPLWLILNLITVVFIYHINLAQIRLKGLISGCCIGKYGVREPQRARESCFIKEANTP